jgi:predicted nucleic acid-binding protein
MVSHSAPLMNLAVVGQVHAPERLYGKVYIPEAVWQERSAIGTRQPWAAVMPALSWLETRSVSHRSLMDLLLLE